MQTGLSFILVLGLGVFFSPLAQADATPIDITADSLTVQHTKGQATFSGNVKVVRGSLTLTSNNLQAAYSNGGKGLSSLVATGNVHIMRGETETATGDNATFNPTTNTLTLTGTQVVLTQGPSKLVGDKLVYDLATQSARVTRSGGPVQATFVSQ